MTSEERTEKREEIREKSGERRSEKRKERRVQREEERKERRVQREERRREKREEIKERRVRGLFCAAGPFKIPKCFGEGGDPYLRGGKAARAGSRTHTAAPPSALSENIIHDTEIVTQYAYFLVQKLCVTCLAFKYTTPLAPPHMDHQAVEGGVYSHQSCDLAL